MPSEKIKYGMTATEEKVFDRKSERHFKGQREIPNGRDFRWNTYRFSQYDMGAGKTADKNFRDNFDRIFPKAPGVGI